jgi:uncharacterized membrane protein YeiH
VFAASGSIAAGQCGLDLLGCVAVGTITAVGGGTLRDVVVLRKEPFWSGADGEVEYIYLAVAGSLLAFVLYPLVGEHAWPDDMWPDAVSLGAFGVIGAMNGVRAGLPIPLILVCGAMTGTGGGATRDIILKKPVRIFHSHKVSANECNAVECVQLAVQNISSESFWIVCVCKCGCAWGQDIYATAAGAGAGSYLLAKRMGLPLGMRIGVGIATTVALRAAGLRLPTWERK